MLFQINNGQECFAIDLVKIDIIQIEDSQNLGETDRYALCFYTIGIEHAATFNISRLLPVDRIRLFEAVCLAKQNGVAHIYCC